MKEEIQIEQQGTSVPGLGGLNFAVLASLGWVSGGWWPVLEHTPNGVVIQLPKTEFRTFIRNHEITARRPVTPKS